MIPTIYFAGKVKKGGFRETKLGVPKIMSIGYRQIYNYADIFSYKYGGPLAISCDHGCFHGHATHGMTAGEGGFGCGGGIADGFFRDNSPIDEPIMPDIVVHTCANLIQQSSCVLAYIDSIDSFGTFAEIGFAFALHKPVYLCIERDSWMHAIRSDLWFLSNMAIAVLDNFDGAMKRISNDFASKGEPT